MFSYTGWNPCATPQMADAAVREYIDEYANPRFYGWAIEALSAVLSYLAGDEVTGVPRKTVAAPLACALLAFPCKRLRVPMLLPTWRLRPGTATR